VVVDDLTGRLHILDLARGSVEAIDLSRLGTLTCVAVTDQRVAIGCQPAAVVAARLDAGGDSGHNPVLRWGADKIDAIALAGDTVLAATGSEFAKGFDSASNELLCFQLHDGGDATQVGETCRYDSYGRALALAPDGRTLVLGTGNGNLYRFGFDPASGCRPLSGLGSFVGHDVTSPDLGGGQLLSQSGDVVGIAFVDDSTFVSVSIGDRHGTPEHPSSSKPELRCWSVEGQETLLDRLDGQPPGVRRRPRMLSSVAVARRRGLILVGTVGGELEVWPVPAR
jgi:hypothetical protein